MLNNLGAAKRCDHSWSKRFAQEGRKIGYTEYIRKPVQFVGTTGTALSTEDIVELDVPVSITTQRGVHLTFTSADFVLSIDDFANRYLKSAAANLANAVDRDILLAGALGFANQVGTPGTIPSGATAYQTYLNAKAKLAKNGVPQDDEDLTMIVDPDMEVNLVGGNATLFNQQSTIGQQNVRGSMGKNWGFNFFMDQNTYVRTVGPLGGSPAVNGANQTGGSLITNGWTAAAALRLNQGDKFNIAGVYAVNPMSKQSTLMLQDFTVAANVNSDASGNATIPIYPAIVTTGPYQNVTNSPANAAAITVTGTAGTQTRQGLAWHREAVALVSVPLPEPNGVDMVKTVTDPESGISIRIIRDWWPQTDSFITRAECLYGVGLPRPEWGVVVQS
jgi:hypothetical protein